ncbi:MAG: hypothetical protein WCZ23_02990 [Rhodospirillaceae bacterium]
MGTPRYSYEVKTQRDGRWTVDRVTDSEAIALKRASELSSSGQVEAVRVEKERVRSDGTFGTPTVIFEQSGTRKDPQVTITPIDDAPDCASLEDLYGIEARITMWRVLRKYFEQVVLTPSEVLHSYSALSRLMDNDPPVYPSAVDRVATIQARKANQDPKARRDELFRWCDMVASRAREADREKPLHKLKTKDFAKLLDVALEEGGPARRDHLVRCTIARDLYGRRNFLEKLEVLLAAVNVALDRDTLGILDGFIADVLGSATVIQELLGSRTNLCEALMGMVDLMEGKEEDHPPRDVPDIVRVLRGLFADGRLPGGAAVLLERVRTQLSGKQPLSRNDPSKETDSLVRLTGRLMNTKGFIGGPIMAEALTQRCGLQFQEGGDLGRRKSVTTMFNLIRDPVQRIRYLLTIAETETGAVAQDDIVNALRAIMAGAADIHAFVSPKVSMPKKLMTISDVQRSLMASKLPAKARKEMFDHLDDLLADFVEREGFIARLDDPDLQLRERATRLVKFCSSGILIEGKALQIARRRIAGYLRQPNFVEHLTDGCASRTEAEEVVRDFYRQLADAGFASLA